MTLAEKQVYEEKAAKMNEEKVTAFENGLDPGMIGGFKASRESARHESDLVAATAAMKKDPNWIFECKWAGCTWQFEDAMDLIDHACKSVSGHVATTFKDGNPGI